MLYELCQDALQNKIFPLILAFLGFGFLVTIHELGHFLFSKLFGIHTPTFSIGFGPTLFAKKIGTTKFQIAAIPLGGYVEIAGLAEPGQGEQKLSEDTSSQSFNDKPYYQKFLVMMGGIMFNLGFAYLVFIGMYLAGMPQEQAHITTQEIVKDSPAEQAGLKKKDIILKVNNTSLSTIPKEVVKQLQEGLLPAIKKNPNKKLNLEILRSGEKQKLAINLGAQESSGKSVGLLGAMFSIDLQTIKGAYTYYSLPEAIKLGIARTHQYIRLIFIGIGNLIANRSLQGAGGPIMILSTSFEMAQKGIRLLLIFLAIISINLAVLNMLPLGIVDGGQLVMVTIETIARRKIPMKVKIVINLVFWLLFLGLFVYLSYKDLIRLLS